mmetsp:Transcript_19102/g.31443  ORF Transcript_19102/g.31443 Transcript_19102/m.31443 type:complete len:237 (+) Transcript_19102:1096-1806(+)
MFDPTIWLFVKFTKILRDPSANEDVNSALSLSFRYAEITFPKRSRSCDIRSSPTVFIKMGSDESSWVSNSRSDTRCVSFSNTSFSSPPISSTNSFTMNFNTSGCSIIRICLSLVFSTPRESARRARRQGQTFFCSSVPNFSQSRYEIISWHNTVRLILEDDFREILLRRLLFLLVVGLPTLVTELSRSLRDFLNWNKLLIARTNECINSIFVFAASWATRHPITPQVNPKASSSIF